MVGRTESLRGWVYGSISACVILLAVGYGVIRTESRMVMAFLEVCGIVRQNKDLSCCGLSVLRP